MRLSDFDYHLPPELIAQHPLAQRDQARLLVLDRRTGTMTHERFDRVGKYLPENATLVFNNSRVIPARLFGTKESTGANIEVFVLKRMEESGYFEVLLRPLKRLAQGDVILFKDGFQAQLIDKDKRIIRFNRRDVMTRLDQIGHMPLPPYIDRDEIPADKEMYQTVYAKKRGSVAAPTAGLHFTTELIQELNESGLETEYVTLHVNYGTFKPVESKDIRKHRMHSETYSMNKSAYDRITRRKENKRPLVAVGTTSCRVLESVAIRESLVGETDLFIYPGFPFRMVDHLITNFHQPRSTLLMLVSAFAGNDLIRRAYEEAIRHKYRMLSYGDAMLIL